MENIVMDALEKRPLSPPSSFDFAAKAPKLPSRKVCIISVLPMSQEFLIFIVDLNSRANTDDGCIPLYPSILLDWENDGTAFCVIDSTLYIFECRQKSVFFIDLSSSDSYSSSKLDKSKLPWAGDMKHTKRTPYAIPTPDGKILVFSTVIPFATAASIGSIHQTGDDRVDFELYDPSAKSWDQLPALSDVSVESEFGWSFKSCASGYLWSLEGPLEKERDYLSLYWIAVLLVPPRNAGRLSPLSLVIGRLKSFCEEGEWETLNEQIILQNKETKKRVFYWKLMHESDPANIQKESRGLVMGTQSDGDFLISNQGLHIGVKTAQCDPIASQREAEAHEMALFLSEENDELT